MTALFQNCPDHIRLHRQGWICSMVFHVIMGAGALTLASNLTPSFESDAFTWTVALVEPPSPQQTIDAVQEVESKPTPIPPKPKVVESQPAPSEPVVEPVQQRVIHPTQVVQRQVTQTVQAATQITAVNQTASTVIAQAVQYQEVSRTAEPVTTQDKVVQAEQPPQTDRVAEEAVASVLAEQLVSRPTAEPVTQPLAVEAPSETTTQVQQPAVEQAVASSASTKAAPTAKADYGWLMKALLGRVNELKNYPHMARINHWEGKVVLRAVIKDDGHVLTVDVQESSGRSVLDNDAMETLWKASPIRLEHPLGKPQLAILMPISYSLR